MAKTFSGKEIIKILSQQYGFEKIGVSGSHVKMRKKSAGKAITTIVPLHSEVLMGTFRNILRLANIDVDDFMRKSKE